MGGKADRRLAMERHLQRAERLSCDTVAWPQSVGERGIAHSRPAQLESQLQRAGDSGSGWVQENWPVLRSQCLLAATDRNFRERGARRAFRAGLVQRGHVVVQTSNCKGRLEFAVSGGVLQRFQPCELRYSEPDSLQWHCP